MPKLSRCATEISDNMVVRTRSEKYTSQENRLGTAFVQPHRDCKAPCQLACPAETDCQGYVGLIANGEYEEAVALIKENCPARKHRKVCPHPCEDACRRNFVDKPVAIAALKGLSGILQKVPVLRPI